MELPENPELIREKMETLRADLQRYSNAYYAENESLISDVEFDRMLRELEELEAAYPQYKAAESPTARVGSSLKDTKFQKVRHKKPMLSLSNSYNIGEVKSFAERVYKTLEYRYKDLPFVLELKLDGASISLQYENGKLARGVTRGDGIEGEDVTENIFAVASIPRTLPEPLTLEVRGEIVLPKSKFAKINEIRLARGEEIFANPRNAASGTLRQIESQIVAERGLDAYFYFLVDAPALGLHTHSDSIRYLERLGFQTTGIFELISDMDKMEARIAWWESAREELDYETDGMVIKLDDMDLWEEVGYTTKSPRWAIAYKFPAKQVTTLLEDVTWQVGRTGKLTPVAELSAVELSGSRIKRASLHNLDEIRRKDIRIGDRVFIEKAAEIIPQVVSAVKELRTGKEQEIPEPAVCPVCGGKLEREAGLIDLKCVNPQCPAIIQGTIEYFVSRDGMNITGLGAKIVEKFLKLGYIKDVSDIYRLDRYRGELIALDKMGEKSVDNLLASIEASKARPYAKTLYALGIPNVGKFLGNLLAKKSKTLDRLAEMTVDELLAIGDVGEKIATAVYDFFRQPENQALIQKLKDAGVNFSETEETPSDMAGDTDNPFRGKTFLFTGKLARFTREDIKDIVERLGGENLSGVSKKLDYLIVGEDAGSKLAKARALGTVKILGEEEFFALCKDRINI